MSRIPLSTAASDRPYRINSGHKATALWILTSAAVILTLTLLLYPALSGGLYFGSGAPDHLGASGGPTRPAVFFPLTPTPQRDPKVERLLAAVQIFRPNQRDNPLASRPSQNVISLMEQNLVYVIAMPSFADSREAVFCGSGFFFNAGYILTNNHVTEKNHGVIYVINKTLNFAAEVTLRASTNQNGRDYAVLAIGSHSQPIRPLKFSTKPQIGGKVSAWGYPMRFISLQKFDITSHQSPEVAYSTGEIKVTDDRRYPIDLLHDSPLFGGNSGGPLINEHGGVLGINTRGLIYRNKDLSGFMYSALKSSDIIAFLRDKGYHYELAD
ncbi:MAG: serine protease [Deltaproteobacteria bacterium]|jgi:S1-C subfamily serine protease|nr:serine protease [Deltaproteobacteria bacterium]